MTAKRRFSCKRSTIVPVPGTAFVLKGRDQDNLRSQPTADGSYKF
jgi:hypothetical protein